MKNIKYLLWVLVALSGPHVYAEESNSRGLTIYSSNEKLEIKDVSTCSQSKRQDGTISINCTTQCAKSIDKKDGIVLITC
jgi:hypothetical protein